MNFDLQKKYKEKVVKFAFEYGEPINDHIVDVMVSVCMTRDGVQTGGSFVQAVVNNNLLEAICRADKEVLNKLRIITLANHYCYL